MTKKPFYDVFLNDIWSFSLYKLFPINQSKFDHLTSETPPAWIVVARPSGWVSMWMKLRKAGFMKGKFDIVLSASFDV